MNVAYNIPQQYYTDSAYQQVPIESDVQPVISYKKKVPAYTANRFTVLDELTSFAAALVKKSQLRDNRPVYVFKEAINRAALQHTALYNDAVWKGCGGYNAIIAQPNTTLFEYGKK